VPDVVAQQQVRHLLLEGGSAGEWMRFTPHAHPSPSAVSSSRTADSTRSTDSPAAPKKPSSSARANAVTIAVVAMPLAISPAT
jgi:hypothetical protein